MEKDKTITDIIKKLRREISFNSLEIVDYWEADLCAIGLQKGNRLVYISTYNYTEDTETYCDFDMEIIDQINKEKLNIVGVGRSVSVKELADALRDFFEV